MTLTPDIADALYQAGLQCVSHETPRPLPLRCTCGHGAFVIDEMPETIRCSKCQQLWKGLSLRIDATIPVVSITGKIEI